jgi:hypothetical protein
MVTAKEIVDSMVDFICIKMNEDGKILKQSLVIGQCSRLVVKHHLHIDGYATRQYMGLCSCEQIALNYSSVRTSSS